MSSFADKLVNENIELLEQHIKHKFIALMRKDNLISAINICPLTFELSLKDMNAELLEPSRLSAGERQLLAIAILWGLAEASGKEIPTVIDTPLGRLDGEHRTKLIDHYFPLASSQVILLSTDEEINGEYYSKLNNSVAQEYSINYLEKERTSEISKGYFNAA
jgi:DNA sulfur modification protein DndD